LRITKGRDQAYIQFCLDGKLALLCAVTKKQAEASHSGLTHHEMIDALAQHVVATSLDKPNAMRLRDQWLHEGKCPF